MLIDYENVSIYQDDDLVLKNVNIHIDEGQFVYIIGKVGSGKSSLLKTMYCELDIDTGHSAKVFGMDLMKMKRKHVPELRKQMGIIFQDFKLLHDRSVLRNLDFVLKATGWKKKQERHQRVMEVLTRVGLEDKLDKMPHELSGGEQQRIAIARALLNNPRLIIADEPTGNLDQDTAHEIVAMLQDICRQGTTVIMSTHNLNLIEKFTGTVYECTETNDLRQVDNI